jgi:DNA modification methylase
MYSGGWAHDDLGTNENPGKGDAGDFSRFYSLDEWWKFRMSRLPEEIQRTFPFLIVPKASKSEKNMGLENNLHPTVKPIDLMSYLVVLGSRKGDVVLDPFSGSGTTGIACVFSERNYILIEREKEYFNIMEARIKKAKNPADLVEHEWF